MKCKNSVLKSFSYLYYLKYFLHLGAYFPFLINIHCSYKQYLYLKHCIPIKLIVFWFLQIPKGHHRALESSHLLLYHLVKCRHSPFTLFRTHCLSYQAQRHARVICSTLDRTGHKDSQDRLPRERPHLNTNKTSHSTHRTGSLDSFP